MEPGKALLEAIAVSAELTGTLLSKGAARVMALDLAQYPEPMVLGALQKCRKELKGRLTIADVIARLDDGRPGPEEAWAMLPRGEGETVVWSAEMSAAWGVCRQMMDGGEMVPARMAFIERYRMLVADARDKGVAVKWTPTLGCDVVGREGPLLDAESKGRLSADEVRRLLPARHDFGITALPSPEAKRDVKALLAGVHSRLTQKPKEEAA